METPLVSVVIPVFNGMPYLPDALASVEKQNFPNIEVVIVDGGSSDGSLEWLEQSGHEYEVHPSSGAAETWTHATQQSHGEYVMLLCQDDLLYPNAIATHVAALERQPSAIASIAQRDIIDARSRTIWKERGLGGLASGIHEGTAVLRECVLRGTNIIGEPHCVMFRREVLMEVMPWDGRLPYLLDLATYSKVLEKKGASVVLTRGSFGAFRVSSNSWSTRLTAIQLEQMQTWQQDIARKLGLSDGQLHGALRASRKQAFMRNLVYRYLAATKRLTAT